MSTGSSNPRCAQTAQDAESVHLREHEVEDDELRLPIERAGESRGAVARDRDLVALDLEVVAEAEREIGVVLHDQDAGPHAAAPHSGSTTTNRAPRVESSIVASPPCLRASSRTTLKPMPLPATADCASRSNR